MWGKGRKEDAAKAAVDDTMAALSLVRESARMIAQRTTSEPILREVARILAAAERAGEYQQAIRKMKLLADHLGSEQ